MQFDQNNQICWKNFSSYEKMLDGARGILFPKLLESDHVQILKALINAADPSRMVDLGCCSAEVSLLADKFEYVGADLRSVIENVSKKMHPEIRYIEFDADDSNFLFVKEFDTVLMNAFIDVLKNGTEVLRKILKAGPQKVILHRQSIKQEESYSLVDSPYGGMTYCLSMSALNFKNLLEENCYKVKLGHYWSNDYYSFLLEKK